MSSFTYIPHTVADDKVFINVRIWQPGSLLSGVFLQAKSDQMLLFPASCSMVTLNLLAVDRNSDTLAIFELFYPT